ncbi:MAG: GNAT family N-acetyltransferase [Chitinophagaceae bacterium]|nr:GNAT family N-acetyltransferase [Chitinophagaceae bacterium]
MGKNRIREATVLDIPEIQRVRNNVEENQLSDPSLVTDSDVADYITQRGKGWVYADNERIVAFAIVSVTDRNVWALFVEPGYDKKGIGRQLHDRMMDWYFGQTADVIWLSTTPGTRAESFYRKSGWQEAGLYGKGEIRFEMTFESWKNRERAAKS